MLWHIGLVAVGRSWVLTREKTILGGPFTYNNGSCLGVSRVCSFAIFISEPAISTLQNYWLIPVVIMESNRNVPVELGPKALSIWVELETLEEGKALYAQKTRRGQKMISVFRS